MAPQPQLWHLSHYTGEAVTCCGLAAVKHTCHNGTSRNRPRTQQIAVWSSSYLQPTIITTHSLNGGAELAHLLVLPRLLVELHDLKNGMSLWLSLPPLLWHGEHPRCFSTVCSGNFCKANTGEWRVGHLQAMDPPVCSQSISPPWKHFCPGKIVCSWATHTMYNAQCRAAKGTAGCLVECWLYFLCFQGH